MDIKDKMLELRNHVVRYGHIVEDKQYTQVGNHMRETTFMVDGMQVTIHMCNGEVLYFAYN